MKRGSTLFLKVVIALIAVAAVAIAAFVLPAIDGPNAGGALTLDEFQDPLLWYAYLASIPFFVGLFQAFKLLNYIDANKAFSTLSVTALKNIKYCAIITIVMVVLAVVYLLLFIAEERPPVIFMGLLFTFGATIIGTFAAVLQKLIQNGVDIKSENDLTV